MTPGRDYCNCFRSLPGRSVDLEWLVEFALPADQPLLLQRMEIRNHQSRFSTPTNDLCALRAGELHFSEERPERRLFSAMAGKAGRPPTPAIWRKTNPQLAEGLSTPMLYEPERRSPRKDSQFSPICLADS